MNRSTPQTAPLCAAPSLTPARGLGDAAAVAQQRVFLDITLQSDCHGKAGSPRDRLSQLLHSALGVYIIGTSVAGENVVVRFDIAAADVDFTLHMLITALPGAMIGRLVSRGV
ncbi:hypothetical protein [Robbsia sp. KACC 23696]|uniref:hypothetical protein n=1 Tax=Robbsia sp. KACC 23696 TaxID=3149231 RepID=UPI00325B99AE